MATVMTNYSFPVRVSNKGLRRKSSPATTLKTETFRERTIRRSKAFAFYFGLISLLLLLLSTFTFFHFYNYYSALVTRRINSGFWHSRGGIYAGSIKLRKGQNLSQAKVVELLRRAGYVEGFSADEIWNGNFVNRENAIEIRSNGNDQVQSESVLINFTGDKISRISNLTVRDFALDSYEIEPELLTGRSESKRGKNHVLKYEEIPENLRQAILTAEDTRFFDHYGLDPRGIARAFFKNLSEGKIKQGGSTITQQLAKNTFLSPEKTFTRKFAEAFLALALERQLSKEEIFTLYCNEIYLGQYGSNGVHGVEEAAQAYFDKDLKDLNLNEAAAIAAMIKNPNRFAPHKNQADANNRRKWIIAEMAEAGLIDVQTAATAQNSELALAPPKLNKSLAPYFVDSITRELTTSFESDYLNTNFNTRVYSTIDTELQALAEQAVAQHLTKLDQVYAKKGLQPQATLVSIDPRTGQVLAMVGGRDYAESQFNRATDAKRQPGSVFKPFVYATAIERGKSPTNVYNDSPTKFEVKYAKAYEPSNYGDSYTMTNISLKTALAKSSNIVAIKTAFDAGLGNIAEKAEDFGFEDIKPYPSMALGAVEVTPLQLAAAYAAFANGGRKVTPTFIKKIVSGEGENLYQTVESNKQVISPQTAYIMTDMLAAVVSRGTARSAINALGTNVAFVGKTGTSKDGWFVGYTPNLVTVVWIGFDQNEDIRATGGETALPLWTEYMKSVVNTRPEFGGRSFPVPPGLVTINIDPATGMMAGPYCPHKEPVVVRASYVSNFDCFEHRPATNTFSAEKVENINYSEPSVSTYDEPQRIEFSEDIKVQEIKDEPAESKKPEPVKELKEIEVNPALNRLENKIEVKKPEPRFTKPVEITIKPAITENKSTGLSKEKSETSHRP